MIYAIRRESAQIAEVKTEYIFRQQIEDADFIVMNRIDEITSDDADKLTQLLSKQFPDIPLIPMSAKSGAGFEALCEFVDQQGSFGRRVMDVDYEIYAEGDSFPAVVGATAARKFN